MKTITHRIAVLGLLLIGLFAVPTVSSAQTLLNTVTNSVAITDPGTTTFTVSATTNIVANAKLFVPLSGEIMCVQSIPVSGTVTVRRGCDGGGSLTATIPVTTTFIIITPTTDGAIGDKDMGGSCTRGLAQARYSPYINKINGNVWVCRSSLWQATNLRPLTYASLEPFTP